ncbi:hypothetical protein QNH46_13595 [Paenibacillus woosongensis]|uniref:Uncharacterized protein n=1 Tax=Paenibacillus woosongensis TaxID=307580 RepID=A0AA95L141_9BACL|nr:hypothetical protein [Paenibacillus woosongensis]WHX47202.1 hypothetical protein QNH46_13595 [Paenibacillus woosongensis]
MVLLNSPLKEEIEKLIEVSNQEYDLANYEDSIKLLEEAWEKLPIPKVTYDDSYHIVKYIIETYLFMNKAEMGAKWISMLFICDLEREDSGEREFIAGKVSYETDDLVMAKELFYVANNKSEGRCFEDEDTKYLKFFKS